MAAQKHADDGHGAACDHCEGPIDGEPLEGEDGEYCGPTCRYDREVLEVTPEELPPRPQGGGE